ncbi:flagellin [Salinarimonas soli]|uniref:Flagellin n=1 Tax=Salinarimonas soli TaxID=1638099 RepID=A0A5B2VZQ9_9HYPH|nr:flagellin [Salinarimonas soli]KAA2244178.1 flagellin [Salinarimonas soli]
MSNITLSSPVRNTVLTLQNIAGTQATVQNRLATGLKVSSALDDPRNFFQASALNNRASDLARLQDSMGLAIKTFEAADKGIKAMTKLAENMAAIAKSALDATTATARTDFQTQFEELRKQMAAVAADSGINGVNLLGGDVLTTEFDEKGINKQAVTGVDWRSFNGTSAYVATDAAGVIGVTQATAWGAITPAADTAIKASADLVKAAITKLRDQAAVFGSNLTVVKVREDFTKEMINTLKGGADGLTLADQNEEAANLLALQTRQQLSQQALSLATQSEQGILRLFG